MVLDPLTAVSLAGVVVQFLDFSSKVFSKTREIYRCNGCPGRHDELECVREDFLRIFQNIGRTSIEKNEIYCDPKIQDLAQRGKSLSKELLDCLEKLRSNGEPRSKLRSFHDALRNTWKQNKIDDFQSRLSDLRDQMILHLQDSQRYTTISVPSLNENYYLHSFSQVNTLTAGYFFL